jgi:hypothetical protein
MMQNIPKLISIVGTDGAGKSCLSRLLHEHLLANGVNTILVWSRFNNYFSKPFLAFTRLTGHNHYINVDGIKMGCHDFEKISYFRHLFSFLQLLDVNIATYFKIYRKLNNFDSLICERGPWDTLVDVATDIADRSFVTSSIGSLYVQQVLSNSTVFLISRNVSNIFKSRPELNYDSKLSFKYDMYHVLADRYGWNIIDNNGLLDDSFQQIIDALKCSAE